MKKRYLVLSSGAVFEGYALGAEGEGLGELVFTTNMCGYPETLTDPSYAGQIILQTFPLIGNYGIIPEDFEGECRARGYVVREACEAPSNFRCQMTLDAFLKERGVPAIMGVDTREITRILREEGVMNALIFSAGNYSFAVFVSGAFVTALPGIVIQLVLLPAVVLLLEKARLVEKPY